MASEEEILELALHIYVEAVSDKLDDHGGFPRGVYQQVAWSSLHAAEEFYRILPGWRGERWSREGGGGDE